jgi:hypothetical protein
VPQHGPLGVEDAHVEVGHQHEDAFELVGPADPDGLHDRQRRSRFATILFTNLPRDYPGGESRFNFSIGDGITRCLHIVSIMPTRFT